MKVKVLLPLLLFIHIHSNIYTQDIINQLKEFYANTDFDCYEKKIQEDIYKFDSLLIGIPEHSLMRNNYRPSYLDLSQTRNIFIPAVTFVNDIEIYDFEDNIYDYLKIDSLRSFIIVCVDEKQNVLGFTDTLEPGSFVDIKDDFYIEKKKKRKKIQQLIKNINKEEPELILFCSSFGDSFLYIKKDKIYHYGISSNPVMEFNEIIRMCPDINIIRRSNIKTLSVSQRIEASKTQTRVPLFYSLTDNLSPDEMRICPDKLVEESDNK